MKSTAFAILLFIMFLCCATATDAAFGSDTAKVPEAEDEVEIAPGNGTTVATTPEVAQMCFFAANPPADTKYVLIKKIKVGKGTYGGVRDILPKFAEYAQKIGADAVINYTGSQRFGFWPWRMIRPVVRGEAVKWSGTPTPDCAAMGGSTLDAILATDRPPPH